MDAKNGEIRYQRWVQVIQDWSNNGLSKQGYCQQNAIDEKQFYYYQRRIRTIIAAQSERPAIPASSFSVATSPVGEQSNSTQIVKLRFPGKAEATASMISLGGVQGFLYGANCGVTMIPYAR